MFFRFDKQPGFRNSTLRCSAALTACLPSKPWKWETKVGTGRPPHSLVNCPKIVIDIDEGWMGDYSMECFFCGGRRHLRYSCKMLADAVYEFGEHRCAVCNAKNAHYHHLCNRPWCHGYALQSEPADSLPTQEELFNSRDAIRIQATMSQTQATMGTNTQTNTSQSASSSSAWAPEPWLTR